MYCIRTRCRRYDLSSGQVKAERIGERKTQMLVDHTFSNCCSTFDIEAVELSRLPKLWVCSYAPRITYRPTCLVFTYTRQAGCDLIFVPLYLLFVALSLSAGLTTFYAELYAKPLIAGDFVLLEKKNLTSGIGKSTTEVL